jgi:hypothetical protein
VQGEGLLGWGKLIGPSSFTLRASHTHDVKCENAINHEGLLPPYYRTYVCSLCHKLRQQKKTQKKNNTKDHKAESNQQKLGSCRNEAESNK